MEFVHLGIDQLDIGLTADSVMHDRLIAGAVEFPCQRRQLWEFENGHM
jgi:hypothetical protein